MTRLLAAVAFLTRLPVRRPFDGADVGRSTLFFPAVGAGIGLVQLGLFHLLERSLSPLLTATFVVAASAWMTRAIHHDGLADFVDGLAGGRERERTLEIMRDSRIGAFGAIALVLLLIAKIAAIASLGLPVALVLAGALARWASVPLSFLLPYARREGGLGAALTENVGVAELAGATLLVAPLGLLVPPAILGTALAAAVGVSAVVGGIAMRRLSGITGDVLGANVELVETIVLVVAAGWVPSA